VCLDGYRIIRGARSKVPPDIAKPFRSLPIATVSPSVLSPLVTEIPTAIQTDVADAHNGFVCPEHEITKAGRIGLLGEIRKEIGGPIASAAAARSRSSIA
jgi:hypothetical protein